MYRGSARPDQLPCARCRSSIEKRDSFMDTEGNVLCRTCNAQAVVAAGAADVRIVSEGAPLQNLLRGIQLAVTLLPLAGIGAGIVGLVFHAAPVALGAGAFFYAGGTVAIGFHDRRRWVRFGLAVGALVACVCVFGLVMHAR